MNFNNTNDPEELGEAVLHVRDVTQTKTDKELKIYDSDTGAQIGTVTISVVLSDTMSAVGNQTQIIFEYQRWKPVLLWGNSVDHMLETDPGSWSLEDGSKFGKSIQDLVGLPEGWEVKIPWSTRSTVDDVEGWSYALDFSYVDWFPVQGMSRFWVLKYNPPSNLTTNPLLSFFFRCGNVR